MSFRKKAVLVGLFITLIGFGLCFRATEHGVGLSRDSVSYLHYARILIGQEPARTPQGDLAVSLSHYPPLYPLTLAALRKIGVPLLSGARTIDVLCYGLLAGLSYWIVVRNTESIRRAAVVAFMVILQPAVAFVHLWGISEPTFLLLTVALAGLLAEYGSQRGRGRWLALAAGFTIAAASLQRYIGPALLPAALFVVWRSRHRVGRWVDLLILVSSALLPVLLLGVIQRMVIGEVAHRTFQYNALTMERLWGVLETFTEWLAADRIAGPARWALSALFLGSAVALVIGWGKRTGLRQATLAITVSYSVLLVLSVMFVDNGTPLDRRILSPLAVLWQLWLVAELPSPMVALAKLRRQKPDEPAASAREPIWPNIVACVTLACVGANAYVGTDHFVALSRSKGFGFSHRMFRMSELVKACRNLPAGAVVYSNFPEPIWLYAHLDAKVIPGHPTKLGRRQNLVAAPLISVRKALRGGKGYIAYFAYEPGRGATLVPASVDELKQYIPLRLVERCDDGVLLRSSDSLHADYTKPLKIQPTTKPISNRDKARREKKSLVEPVE